MTTAALMTIKFIQNYNKKKYIWDLTRTHKKSMSSFELLFLTINLDNRKINKLTEKAKIWSLMSLASWGSSFLANLKKETEMFSKIIVQLAVKNEI